MRVQQSRTDVLPLTWEIPATIVGCWLVLGVLALPAGQAAASWVTGTGYAWPTGEVVETTLRLLRGRPSGGLAEEPALVYAMIAVLESALAALAVLGILVWWRTYGPGAQRGLAGRGQVVSVLGPTNLRRRRQVIRPDLHRSRFDANGGRG